MNSYSPYPEVCEETLPNQFEDNYHGILTHSGEIKIAKCDIEMKIIHVDKNGNVLVSDEEKTYSPKIHMKLLPLMDYVTVGDIGFIKFKGDDAYIVGFRKGGSGNAKGNS